MDQCKIYLRKHGLRLTGKKETLLQRIKEHLEYIVIFNYSIFAHFVSSMFINKCFLLLSSSIINGEGEKKYPVSSFVLNCKGLYFFTSSIRLGFIPILLVTIITKMGKYAGDACTGDVVLFQQTVNEM